MTLEDENIDNDLFIARLIQQDVVDKRLDDLVDMMEDGNHSESQGYDYDFDDVYGTSGDNDGTMGVQLGEGEVDESVEMEMSGEVVRNSTLTSGGSHSSHQDGRNTTIVNADNHISNQVASEFQAPTRQDEGVGIKILTIDEKFQLIREKLGFDVAKYLIDNVSLLFKLSLGDVYTWKSYKNTPSLTNPFLLPPPPLFFSVFNSNSRPFNIQCLNGYYSSLIKSSYQNINT